MKKSSILSILLCFSLSFTSIFAPSVYAQNVQNTPTRNINSNLNLRKALKPKKDGKKFITKVNEYTLFKQLKSKSNTELSKLGFTSKDVNQIRNFDYAKAIRNRASLSEKKLKGYGYTINQIKQLKEVSNTLSKNNNNLEAISPNAITGTLTCGIEGALPAESMNDGTGKEIGAYIYWNWDHMPLIDLVDMIAVKWSGSNSAGVPINTEINNNKYDIQINYVKTNDPYFSTYTSVYSAWSVDDLYHDAHAQLSMMSSQLNEAWAQNGNAYLVMDKVGSDPIAVEGITFAYGHKNFELSSSVSFPAGASISFSPNFSTADSSYMKVYPNGHYE